MLLIVASPHHNSPTPLTVSIGEHTLIITSERHLPELDVETADTSALFDHEEAYQLYLCLHVLFHQAALQAEP